MPSTKAVLDYEMEQVAFELQHVNVKLLIKDPDSVQLAAVIPVFHSWIQGQIFDELLLDVADYAHVPDGPGIVLIGHEADYAVDDTDGRLGIRYNRKTPIEGTNRDRLAQATRGALLAARQLEKDLNLHFNGTDAEIVINDRLLAPNTDKTRRALEPELRGFLGVLFGGAEYSLRYPTERRELFGVVVKTPREFSVRDLLGNLGPAGQ